MAFQPTPPSSSPLQTIGYNPAPPPPPKPLVHSSGSVTPLAALPPPLPPAPGREASNSGSIANAHHQNNGGLRGEGGKREGRGRAGLEAILQSPLPEPPDERWLPLNLRDKSIPNLKQVLDTPSLQSALINSPETTHPSLLASTTKVQHILSDNLALANSLVALESQLQQRRQSAQTRLLALRALERQWRAKEAEQDKALRNFSPPALYQRLSAGIIEQEAYCRSLEEGFLDGEMETKDNSNCDEEGRNMATEREVVDFVKRYREAVKVAYLRRERKARWDEGRVSGWR